MSSYPRKGTALVLCAPSGTGKTTLAKRITARYQRATFSISCTTRKPRQNEVEGKDYYFITNEEFEKRKSENYFAEWAKVHDNYYGTPLTSTKNMLDEGKDLIFDIDVQGAAQLKKSLPGAYFVFIMPPSRAVLEERLHLRGTESHESIAKRMTNAVSELKEAWWFDAWLINDDHEKAFQDLCSVYRAASMSPKRRPDFLNQLLEQFDNVR